MKTDDSGGAKPKIKEKDSPKNNTSASNIDSGKFRVDAHKGTFAGTFRVEISATGKTGKQIQDPLMGMMVDEFEQIIPKQYNLQSELSVEVTADGPNEYDFALESTP